MSIAVVRKPIILTPSADRVIARFYMPGQWDRACSIAQMVASLTEEEAVQLLSQALRRFSSRHRNITQIFETNFETIRNGCKEADADMDSFGQERRLLLGSFFTMEYALEATAFFNLQSLPILTKPTLKKAKCGP